MEFDFKTIKRDGTSADLEAAIAHLNREEPTAKEIEAQYEAGRKACLVDEDNDGADDFERKLVLVRREIDRIAEQRRQLRVRLEEVLQLERKAELDNVYAEGLAAQEDWREAALDYEKHCEKLVSCLTRMEDSTKRVTAARQGLSDAKDPRRLQLPAGLIAEDRGKEHRVDVPKTVRLPALAGGGHFWPRVR